MKRIDPDALYDWCRMMERNVGLLSQPSMALTAVFHEVAEPERPEPVIDEAVYEAGREARRNHFGGKGLTVVMSTLDEAAEKSAITAAIHKYEELRSNACGSSNSPGQWPSSPESCTQPASSLSGADTSASGPAAALAADPRRLTDIPPMPFTPKELNAVWCDTEISYAERQSALARFVWEAAWQAVAASQLAKARVTISEAEIARHMRDYRPGYPLESIVAALLRSHGMEVPNE